MWISMWAAAWAGEVLLQEDFEQGLDAWSLDIGATNGPRDSTSTAEVTAGGRSGDALHLAGDAATHRWQSVASEPLAVSGGDTLALSAWARSEGVRTERGQFPNSYVGLRFTGAREQLVPAGRVEGDAEWAQLERVLEVPDGARHVQVLAFLSLTDIWTRT